MGEAFHLGMCHGVVTLPLKTESLLGEWGREAQQGKGGRWQVPPPPRMCVKFIRAVLLTHDSWGTFCWQRLLRFG